jgi:4-hydroxy-3-polyprenylbenzoate decarboxylase
MAADLRKHIRLLEEHGQLVRVTRPVNKDTELHPLVRWQFLGLPERQRKAFLFENIVDSKSHKYASPVLVGGLASTKDLCFRHGVPRRKFSNWSRAVARPLDPVMRASGPTKEEIRQGNDLMQHGGLDEFPIPISTPGFDNGPYFTACHWVTKDPDTGVRNIGNYRAQIKGPTKTGSI